MSSSLKSVMSNVCDLPSTTPDSRLQPYQYERVQRPDSLRILCLHPSKKESDPLSGSIIQINRYEELAKLSDHQSYAAVSYAWGNTGFSERILIRSEVSGLPDAYLQISIDVQIMMQHFRKRHKPRYLWIDAICLNQQDEQEKAQQIPLMGDIFRQAKKVHIWLGPEDGDDIAGVFAAFRMLALHPEKKSEFARVETHIRKFSKRRWFSRRWILQEARLSQHAIVHCGHHTMLFPVFVSACQLLHEHIEEYGIQMIHKLSQFDRDGEDLFSLLWYLHRSECREKKDRIAALLGFLPTDSQLAIDYTHSYQDLYKDVAIAMAKSQTQHYLILHLFCFGSIRHQEDDSYPSWIPDWSKERSEEVATLLLPPVTSDYKSILPVPQALPLYRRWCNAYIEHAGKRNGLPEKRLWKLWLCWEATYGLRRTTEVPNTVFSVQVNESGRCVLNAIWQNPAAGLYGKDVLKVVNIKDDAESSIDWSPDPERLMPLKENSYVMDASLKTLFTEPGTGKSFNLANLCLLLENVMMNHGTETLRKWQADERRLLIAYALIVLFAGGPPQDMPYTIEHILDPKFHHSVETCQARLQEISSAILVELCQILQKEKLVILELTCISENASLDIGTHCAEGLQIDYGVGHSHMREGMLLIPLASNGNDRNHVNAFDDNDLRPWAWSRHMSCRPWFAMGFATLTNMIAVQPVGSGCHSLNRGRELKDGLIKDFKVSPTLQKRIATNGLPIQAKYVGPCLTVMAWDIADNSIFNNPQWYRNIYALAEQEGLPPPFMIDIL